MVKAGPPPAAQIEYSIHTVAMPKGKEKAGKEEKQDTLDDMDKAIARAEALSASGKYCKVEVRKKFFDVKKNRNVDMTLKAYESRPKKDYGVILVVLFALFCGVGAFAAAYFLGR